MKQVLFLSVEENIILRNALIKYFHPQNKLITDDNLRVIQHLHSYLVCEDNYVDDVKQAKIDEIIYG